MEQQYLDKSQGFQVREDSTWLKHRNNKSCVEEGRIIRLALPPSPVPQAQASQPKDRHLISGSKPVKWEPNFTGVPRASSPRNQTDSMALDDSLGTLANPGPVPSCHQPAPYQDAPTNPGLELTHASATPEAPGGLCGPRQLWRH